MIGSILVLFGGGCALLVSELNIWQPSGRKHLDPIRVSQSACPSVRVMHAAADNFQRVMVASDPLLALLVDVPGEQSGSQIPWPTERARLAQSLNVLEFAVVAAEPKFPLRIRRRLDVVLTSIRSGRVALDAAKDSIDLAGRIGSTYFDGHYAFGDASDLVGEACGVHLAADPPPAK